MEPKRPTMPIVVERLRRAGLRPTRQRVALARLLFDGGDRHVTAEQLHGAALAAAIRVSLATVYNTLHQFTAASLMREVVVEPGRSYFDTNTDDHHHFFCESTGHLQDIPGELVRVGELPRPPAGGKIQRVDVIIRIRQDNRAPRYFRTFLRALTPFLARPIQDRSARVRRGLDGRPPVPNRAEGRMASLKGSKTEDNLKAAFAGESQANRRYLYFAQQADVEGYNDVAAVFRSTAEGETGHAHGHLEFLEVSGDPATGLPIGATNVNLKAAIAGETHEYTDMYPGM